MSKPFMNADPEVGFVRPIIYVERKIQNIQESFRFKGVSTDAVLVNDMF